MTFLLVTKDRCFIGPVIHFPHGLSTFSSFPTEYLSLFMPVLLAASYILSFLICILDAILSRSDGPMLFSPWDTFPTSPLWRHVSIMFYHVIFGLLFVFSIFYFLFFFLCLRVFVFWWYRFSSSGGPLFSNLHVINSPRAIFIFQYIPTMSSSFYMSMYADAIHK